MAIVQVTISLVVLFFVIVRLFMVVVMVVVMIVRLLLGTVKVRLIVMNPQLVSDVLHFIKSNIFQRRHQMGQVWGNPFGPFETLLSLGPEVI